MFIKQDFVNQGKNCDEYILTLQFQLERERDKNKILEQRIRNKQIFIAQMKQMQIQLDELTQKCRVQLHEQRKIRQKLQKVDIRNYLQKIAELEHQLNLQNNRNANQMEPYQKYFTNSKINHNLQATTINLAKSKSSKHLKKNSQQYILMKDEDDENNQIRKRFIVHFMEMVQIYMPTLKQEQEKKKLKCAWRWVKDVVREWDGLKGQVQEYRNFIQSVKQFVNANHDGNSKQLLSQIQNHVNNFQKDEMEEEQSQN